MPTGKLYIHWHVDNAYYELRVMPAGAKKGLRLDTKSDARLLTTARERTNWDDVVPGLLTDPIASVAVDYEERKGKALVTAPPGGAAAGVASPPPRAMEPLRSHEVTGSANPYNYIRLRDRPDVPNELGDRRPLGHHRFHDRAWTGELRLTLTTESPLLVPDAARKIPGSSDGEEGARPDEYPLKLIGDEVHLPESSVRGMLRSAYEAVTNSRLGVIGDHRHRLGHRVPVETGAEMIPARVTDDGTQIELLRGFGEPQHAAWWPCYPLRDRHSVSLPPCIGDPSQLSGTEVEVDVQRCRRERNGTILNVWIVRRLRRYRPPGGAWTAVGAVSDQNLPPLRYPASEPRLSTVIGWLFVSNRTTTNKHDERVFFTTAPRQELVEIDERIRRYWDEVMQSYADVGHQPRTQPHEFLPNVQPPALGPHASSPKQYELVPGRLLYVRPSGGAIASLAPVSVSRRLFEVSPATLVSDDHRPARDLTELSPADRVFGWASSSGQGAYRSQLRVRHVRPVKVDRSEHGGFDVAILGAPSPQPRFRTVDRTNSPKPSGTPIERFFQEGDLIAGRVAYLHSWEGFREETAKVSDMDRPKTTQYRRITQWVNPGSSFEVDIRFTNLTDVEFGALLWLVDRDAKDSFRFRLGLGKPFGFGVVALALNSVRAQTGGDVRAGLRDLAPPTIAAAVDQTMRTQLKDEFLGAQGVATGRELDHPLLRQVVAAHRPVRRHVEYPRLTPDGAIYEWFKRNSVSLPELDLGDDFVPLP